MRISDWSSDVCSSDLVTTISFAEASASRISLPPASLCAHAVLDACRASTAANALVKLLILFPPKSTIFNDDHFLRKDHLVQNDHTVFQEKSVQIGRASCRERVCQYV